MFGSLLQRPRRTTPRYPKQDIKLILEWSKSPGIRLPAGIDPEIGEVRVTLNAKNTLQAAMEYLAQDNSAYADFTKACGVKPKVVYDMAVILVNMGSRYDFIRFGKVSAMLAITHQISPGRPSFASSRRFTSR